MTNLDYLFDTHMGARATRAPGAVAQIVRGQRGGKRLPFLQELHFKTCY